MVEKFQPSDLLSDKSSAVENVSFSVQLIHIKKRNDGMDIYTVPLKSELPVALLFLLDGIHIAHDLITFFPAVYVLSSSKLYLLSKASSMK